MKNTHQEHEAMNQDYPSAGGKATDMTSLVVSLCTDDTKTANAAFRATYDMMKNHAKKSGDDCSFIIGLSNVDVKKNNKIVPYHIHGIAKGDDSEKFTQDIRTRINRKATLANEKAGIESRAIPAKTKPIKELHEGDGGMKFAEYVLSQCTKKQQYSNASDENKFDFRNFNKSKKDDV